MTEPDTQFDGDAVRATLTDTAAALIHALTGTADENDALQAIVAGALRAIPAASGASITLIDRSGTITTHSPSTETIAEIDRIQTEFGEGPCIDALDDTHSGITDAADLSINPRWPRFAEKALASGVRAVLSFQLIAERSAGALNMYSTTAHGFSSTDHFTGSLFADQAAVALAGARRADHLHEALHTRDVIGKARGILMARFRVADPQAFQMLVSASQETNMKLRAVADWVVGEAEAL